MTLIKQTREQYLEVLTSLSVIPNSLSEMVQLLYTKELDEGQRFTKLPSWIENKMVEYASIFDLSPEVIFLMFEKQRGYWSANYYQESNFPTLLKPDAEIPVFETVEDAHKVLGNRFLCPACEKISTSPSDCNSGYIDPERESYSLGKPCDWKSYGLFGCLGKGFTFAVKEAFLDGDSFIYSTFRPSPADWMPNNSKPDLVLLKAWRVKVHNFNPSICHHPTRSGAIWDRFSDAQSYGYFYQEKYPPSGYFRAVRAPEKDSYMLRSNFIKRYPKAKITEIPKRLLEDAYKYHT